MSILFLTGQQTSEVNADYLAPVPGAGERVVAGRSALGDRRRGGGDRRGIERASLQRVFGGAGANLRRRHRAERNAGANDAAAAHRQVCGKRDDRAAFRLDAGDLAVAERLGAGGLLARDREHEGAGLPLARLQEFLDRYVTTAEAALHGNHRVEREQRDGEVAVRIWREQI